MNARLLIVLSALAAFSIYTAAVVAGHGYIGFLELAFSHAWGGQMLIDLVIALVLFVQWMQDDAKSRSLPFIPYLLATLTLGSIGALAYLAHREVAALRRPAPAGR